MPSQLEMVWAITSSKVQEMIKGKMKAHKEEEVEKERERRQGKRETETNPGQFGSRRTALQKKEVKRTSAQTKFWFAVFKLGKYLQNQHNASDWVMVE